ncbi:MAG: BMP family lipoprotein [Bacteroidota bacterium]
MHIVSCGDPVSPGDDYAIGLIGGRGGFGDAGFNAGARRAVEEFSSENGVPAYYEDLSTGEDAMIACNRLIHAGCSIIFAPSMETYAALTSLAKVNPQVKFVLIDNNDPAYLKNVKSMTFRVDQPSFQLGYLSAWWAYSKSPAKPRVGWIGGMNIPSIRIFTDAFTAGVNYYSERNGINTRISQGFTNSFSDPALGEQIANLMLNSGASVIFPVAGRSSIGAYKATAAQSKWAIGADQDKYESGEWYSDIFISSCIKDIGKGIKKIAMDAINGQFSSDLFVGDLSNGGVSIAPYHKYDTKVPDSIRSQLSEIREMIIDGNLGTGWKN